MEGSGREWRSDELYRVPDAWTVGGLAEGQKSMLQVSLDPSKYLRIKPRSQSKPDGSASLGLFQSSVQEPFVVLPSWHRQDCEQRLADREELRTSSLMFEPDEELYATIWFMLDRSRRYHER